jgi:hypothetical protein
MSRNIVKIGMMTFSVIWAHQQQVLQKLMSVYKKQINIEGCQKLAVLYET